MADYAKAKAKKLASNFLSKLVESFDSQKDGDSAPPPKPPPKPYSDNSQPSIGPAPVSSNDIAYNFQTLAISNPQQPESATSHAPFVGGFNPAYLGQTSTPPPVSTIPYSSNNASYQTTPTMSIPTPDLLPQSLTMKLALEQIEADRPCLKPQAISHTSSSTSQSKPPNSSSKPSTSKPSSKPNSAASTPQKLGQINKTSNPSSANSKPDQEQCAGVTKAGKRCTRMVKAVVVDDDDDKDGENNSSPKFCHQHAKEVLGNTGFYARKNGEWVKFEDWIPTYLLPETQLALRVEMEKSRSQSDVPGYIYTFEIRDEEQDAIKLKVGRAVNLVKRIDQWGKQCGSKEQVLRGFYPFVVDSEDAEANFSLLKGRVQAGEKGPCCHRLERLVHLELGDLVSTGIYLEPKWPNVEFSDADTTASDTPTREPCTDCGSMHKEIFEFRRWKKGAHKGKEWQDLVKPVIERWGKFVELYV